MIAVAKLIEMSIGVLPPGITTTVIFSWDAQHIAIATTGEVHVMYNADAIVPGYSKYLAAECWTRDLNVNRVTLHNPSQQEDIEVRIEVMRDQRE